MSEFFKMLGDYQFLTIACLIMFLVSLCLQINVSGTFKKYSQNRTERGLKAHEVARAILDENGLRDVEVVRVGGHLSDHYDPRIRQVALSESVYDSDSVAAAGIAAHECGHAVQHAVSYTPVVIRAKIAPVFQIASNVWFWLFIFGMIIGFSGLIQIAIVVFAITAVFQIVTLPVELDASKRAMQTLGDYNILQIGELSGARRVLSAAAMTYVAALAMSILQLLRLLALSRNN